MSTSSHNPHLASVLEGDRPQTEVLSFGVPHRVRFRSLSGKLTAYPMGLSDDRISHKDAVPLENRGVRGSGGLPKAGKELIEDGTVLLYHLAKAKKLQPVFWTVTVPTGYQDGSRLTDDDHRQILMNWSELVRQIFQEVSRLYERKGLPNRFLYVIEPQEDRWQRDRVFAPHIHAVLVNRWNRDKHNPHKDKGFETTGYWEVELEETDRIVERIFSHLLGKAVNCRSACNIQSIKGMNQLFFYLSKLNKIGRYISKGSQVLGEVKSSRWGDCLPANWYGSDRATRQEVRASVLTLDLERTSLGAVKQELETMSASFEQRHNRPLLSHPHLITIEEGSGEVAVALVSRVHRMSDIPVFLNTLMSWEAEELSVIQT